MTALKTFSTKWNAKAAAAKAGIAGAELVKTDDGRWTWSDAAKRTAEVVEAAPELLKSIRVKAKPTPQVKALPGMTPLGFKAEIESLTKPIGERFADEIAAKVELAKDEGAELLEDAPAHRTRYFKAVLADGTVTARSSETKVYACCLGPKEWRSKMVPGGVPAIEIDAKEYRAILADNPVSYRGKRAKAEREQADKREPGDVPAFLDRRRETAAQKAERRERDDKARAERAKRNPPKPEPKKFAPAKPAKKAKGESKTALIASMLLRKGGTTRREVLTATGWSRSCAIPQHAKAAGLKLRKEKVEGVTHYYGSK